MMFGFTSAAVVVTIGVLEMSVWAPWLIEAERHRQHGGHATRAEAARG